MLEDFFGIVGVTLAGSFHVEEVIAEGGYAVVYRAEHVAFRAPVALKVLKMPTTISAEQSESFVESFREEAEILFHLSGSIPEVVRPLHADAMTLDDGHFVPYLAMEWIEGKPLDSIIILRERDGLPPFAIRDLLDMLTPIAHALHKAHRFQVPGGGIVEVTHCDLKPENIVITEHAQPVKAKILDFGIAKARDLLVEKYGGLDDERRPFTPNYGAPEQWAPREYGQTGPWTDVWGFALTLVECLSGQPVLEGDLRGMMEKVLDESVRPTPRNQGADVSTALENVFDRALAVDPRDRYSSIASFWTAIEHAAGVAPSFQQAPAARDSHQRQVPEPDLEGEEFHLEREPPSTRGNHRPPLPGAAQAGDEFDPDGQFDGLPPAREDHVLDDAEGEFDSGEYVLEPEVEGLAFDEPPISASTATEDDSLSDSGVRRQLDLELTDLELGSDEDEPRSSPRATSPQRAPAGGKVDVPAGGNRAAGGQPAAPELAKGGGAPGRLAQELARSGARQEVRSLGVTLRWPGIALALAFVLTFVDMLAAGETGGFVMLGPVRLRWIAGALAMGGIALAIWNLVVAKPTS